MERSAKENERRKKMRFVMEREIRYRVLNANRVMDAGTGKTLNISSGGVAFTTERTLGKGVFVELSISWPALIDDTCPMKLIAFGRIVRSTNGTAASTIQKYEFRTQSRVLANSAVARPDDLAVRRWADEIRRECASVA